MCVRAEDETQSLALTADAVLCQTSSLPLSLNENKAGKRCRVTALVAVQHSQNRLQLRRAALAAQHCLSRPSGGPQ